MNKQEALVYLGYTNQEISDSLEKMIEECIEEVQKRSAFKAIQATYHYLDNSIVELNLPLHSLDTQVYFDGCREIAVTAYTLGVGIEKYAKLLQKINFTKAVIFDGIASAYLEELANHYDETHLPQQRTYRFAPGYGDLPLALNKELYTALDLNKNLGIQLLESGIFLPQKTMVCLTGLGKENKKKSCGSCIKYKNCFLVKEGKRCWRS